MMAMARGRRWRGGSPLLLLAGMLWTNWHAAASPPDAQSRSKGALPPQRDHHGGIHGVGNSILPEGGGNECGHRAGALLLCMAQWEGERGKVDSKLRNETKANCTKLSDEHWKCVSRQAAASPHGGYVRVRRVRHGFMSFSPFDLYFGVAMELYGEWAESEVSVMSKFLFKGDTVVEVGGHIGSLTVPLAKMVGGGGRLVVFEPQRLLSQYNAANAALNNLSQARPSPKL